MQDVLSNNEDLNTESLYTQNLEFTMGFQLKEPKTEQFTFIVLIIVQYLYKCVFKDL